MILAQSRVVWLLLCSVTVGVFLIQCTSEDHPTSSPDIFTCEGCHNDQAILEQLASGETGGGTGGG